MIIPAFVDYATLLFETFGEDVKWWVTFNEPKQTCAGGYDSAGFSPQNLHPGIGGYVCAHNLLRAHAEVYHIYNETYKATQNGFVSTLPTLEWLIDCCIAGKVSMVIDEFWIEPASNSTDDIEVAERASLMTVRIKRCG